LRDKREGFRFCGPCVSEISKAIARENRYEQHGPSTNTKISREEAWKETFLKRLEEE
jgi:hypothetical protein